MALFSYNQFRAWETSYDEPALHDDDLAGSLFHFMHWFSGLCLWGGIGVALLLTGGRLGQTLSVLMLAWLGTGLVAVTLQLLQRPAALARTALYMVLSLTILYFFLTLGLNVPPSALRETAQAVLAGLSSFR
jgi:hypothetical protein